MLRRMLPCLDRFRGKHRSVGERPLGDYEVAQLGYLDHYSRRRKNLKRTEITKKWNLIISEKRRDLGMK
jgi:hypothetical protein